MDRSADPFGVPLPGKAGACLRARFEDLSQQTGPDHFLSRVAPKGLLPMLRRLTWAWVVVVLLGGVAAPVRAADEPAQPYIVLVGISNHADKQILPRPTAEA